MYVQGNLALKPKRNTQAEYLETRRTVKRKKSIPTREKLLYLFSVGICVAVAGLVIFHYAQIYEVNAKIQQVEKEIKMIESENANLKLEVNKQSDPKLLIEKAKLLGLQPSDEQNISEIPNNSVLSNMHTVALKK